MRRTHMILKAPFLSIIIPVFNVKEFLENCVQSFIDAEYQNFEIILVDDGSEDGSEKMCDMLSNQDSRIKAIHISNSGPSVARNIGIQNAQGTYIYFCDSDDYVDSTAFSCVINEIANSFADLYVLTSCYESDQLGNYFIDDVGLHKGYTLDLSEVYEYTLRIRLSAPWKKFYKRSIIVENSIHFPTGRTLHEDLSFFLNYLKYTSNVQVLDQVMYFHRYAPNSLSHKTEFKQFDDLAKVYMEIKSLVVEKNIGKEKLTFSQTRLLAILMGMIARMKKAKISDKEITKQIVKYRTDSIITGYVPKDIKSIVRYCAYKTRAFKLYSFLYS